MRNNASNRFYGFANDYYEVVQAGLKMPANDNDSNLYKRCKRALAFIVPLLIIASVFMIR